MKKVLTYGLYICIMTLYDRIRSEVKEGKERMKEGMKRVFIRAKKHKRYSVFLCAMALTAAAGVFTGCGAQGAEAVKRDGENGSEMARNSRTGAGHMQCFTKKEVTVVPAVKQYDYADAKAIGTVQQLHGVLPGASDGIWYTVASDGVEYYYGTYGSGDAQERAATLFGYAIFSDRYALGNGIRVGMTMEEILEACPDMAVVDFEGNQLEKEVTGCLGWNGTAYPRSCVGQDKAWAYDGKDYAWTDQFDCVMLAEVEPETAGDTAGIAEVGAKTAGVGEGIAENQSGTADAPPLYMALLVKDKKIAAITFFHPTAG